MQVIPVPIPHSSASQATHKAPPLTTSPFPYPQSKWPALLALGALGVGAWGVFMVFVTNQERLSSSIMQQVMAAVRDSPELRAVIGEAIRPEPVWWLNGDPWIDGAVSVAFSFSFWRAGSGGLEAGLGGGIGFRGRHKSEADGSVDPHTRREYRPEFPREGP